MKTNSHFSKPKVLLGTLSLAALTCGVAWGSNAAPYIAHEWGTFTSVQGGDGVLLDWRPLETSRLPDFVYNWQRPGFNRRSTTPAVFGKGNLTTLQRMETPVIYFYSERQQSVDVSVKFPQGLITEWYPQATQIGPSLAAPGAGSSFPGAASDQSMARWARVELLPQKSGATSPPLLTDASGSHYFAARETDACRLEVSTPGATEAEREKFLFYRGVGSFPAPLHVSLEGGEAGAIQLSNTGAEPLCGLIGLEVENGAGRMFFLEQLRGKEKFVARFESELRPLRDVGAQVSESMVHALAAQGLYEREARAMVATWKDSWFEENGLRVLYLLPRQWTDRTLPLALEPAPSELTRVMVGRAEILAPDRERKLADALRRATRGEPAAQSEAVAQMRDLGRFAEPALALALKGKDSQFSDAARQLLASAQSGPTAIK